MCPSTRHIKTHFTQSWRIKTLWHSGLRQPELCSPGLPGSWGGRWVLRGARGDDGGCRALLGVSHGRVPSFPSRRSLSPRAAPQRTRPRAAATAQAPPRPSQPSRAEPPLPCRPRQIRHKAPHGDPVFRVGIFYFFSPFPSFCFPSGQRSSRRAPAAMEAAAAGERGRAGRGGRGSAHGSRWRRC